MGRSESWEQDCDGLCGAGQVLKTFLCPNRSPINGMSAMSMQRIGTGPGAELVNPWASWWW